MDERKKLNRVEQDLLEGLQQYVDDLKTGEPVEKKYTVRRMVLDLQPREYKPEQVKAVRSLLNISQAVLAHFMGVSVNTVRKWEQGAKPPMPIACRMMDDIQEDPDRWRAKIRKAIKQDAVSDSAAHAQESPTSLGSSRQHLLSIRNQPAPRSRLRSPG